MMKLSKSLLTFVAVVIIVGTALLLPVSAKKSVCPHGSQRRFPQQVGNQPSSSSVRTTKDFIERHTQHRLADLSTSIKDRRRRGQQQEEQDDDGGGQQQWCNICGVPSNNNSNVTLLEDVYPPYTPIEGVLPANLTCGDINLFGFLYNVEQTSSDCLGLQQLFFHSCCKISSTIYQCEQQTRNYIFNQRHIDPNVPPIVSHTQPLQVSVALQFQGIIGIDVQSGTGEFFIWITLKWHDPRLAWPMNEDTCAYAVSSRASTNAETTEIWVPELDLYNRETSLADFVESPASILPDGTVVWTRAGSLGVICEFQGLAQIPFDQLGCQLFFGGQTRFEVQYVLDPDQPIDFGTFAPVYDEFLLAPELSDYGQANDYFALFYTFYFNRAKSYYVFNIVVPTIILTFVSFGTFLLDLRVGERLSYGMALALVVVAQQIVTGDLIPVSDVRTWIDKFVGWSFYWVIFGLLESVFIAYLYFIRQNQKEKGIQNEMQRYHVSEEEEDKSVMHSEQNDDSGREEVKNSAVFNPGNTMEQPGNIVTSRGRQHSRSSTIYQPPTKKLPPKSRWYYTVSLRKIDHGVFFFSIITYSAFLIGMFMSRPQWGKNFDPVYVTNSDVASGP